MCTSTNEPADAVVPGNVAQALRMTVAGLDFLNSPAAEELDGAACAEVLTVFAEIRAKFAAAQATFLRRFDAADAHDADGYGSSSAWLAAKAGMTKRDARRAMRQMRQLTERAHLADALANGELSESWATAIADWTRKLPAELRSETDKILVEAAVAGASLDDLAVIAAAAIEHWRAQHPDPDDDGFDDRYVQVGTTFGGAGVIRGNLTPECTAAVTAVLEALGKKEGPEDDRNEGKRFHDALQQACELLLGARLVPDREGADTQVVVHVPLGELRETPGAADIEQAWLDSHAGAPGYLTGKDAEAAACDALTVPVVTGHADMTVIDKIIRLAQTDITGLSPEAASAHRYAIARLAIDFVSGPNGIASALRTGLLDHPYNTPSLPLDIGYSDSIPPAIRRAVKLRDKHCRWPGCDRRPAYCDVHHIIHQKDGGETKISNCVLLCQFHHDICIHRWGWQFTLHPDGTTEARSPDGRILHSHAPPTSRAALPAGYEGLMSVFAVTTAKGPNWDRSRGIREQQFWAEHAAFADTLGRRSMAATSDAPPQADTPLDNLARRPL